MSQGRRVYDKALLRELHLSLSKVALEVVTAKARLPEWSDDMEFRDQCATAGFMEVFSMLGKVVETGTELIGRIEKEHEAEDVLGTNMAEVAEVIAIGRKRLS